MIEGVAIAISAVRGHDASRLSGTECERVSASPRSAVPARAWRGSASTLDDAGLRASQRGQRSMAAVSRRHGSAARGLEEEGRVRAVDGPAAHGQLRAEPHRRAQLDPQAVRQRPLAVIDRQHADVAGRAGRQGADLAVQADEAPRRSPSPCARPRSSGQPEGEQLVEHLGRDCTRGRRRSAAAPHAPPAPALVEVALIPAPVLEPRDRVAVDVAADGEGREARRRARRGPPRSSCGRRDRRRCAPRGGPPRR